VEQVAQECDLPYYFVEKLLNKFKKRQRRDCDFLVASNIMQHVMMGTQQRTRVLTNVLNELEGMATLTVSDCCHGHVQNRKELGPDAWFCSRCKMMCQPVVIANVGIVEAINDTITQLRDEDTALVTYAEKMGFTERQEPAPVRVTNYNIQMNGKTQQAALSPDTLQQVQALPPAQRGQLRRQLEQKILEEAQDGTAS